MKARIKITLKNGVLDPQGKAVQGVLGGLGIAGVTDVRQGKYIEVDPARPTRAAQRPLLKSCARSYSPIP
jgi:phosphoribosylformylglycinamidine synthase subunit PurS